MEKHTTQVSESLALAAVLTFSGGFMDAYSYICRGGVFANAQTGNILLFGVNFSVGEWAKALSYFIPVLAFTLGIACAEFVRHFFGNSKAVHWRQLVSVGECVIFLAVSFISQKHNLIANSMISLACGAQVEAFRKIKGNFAATTMCIGNLRAATQNICSHLFMNDALAARKGIMFYGVIAVFVIGAVFGNIAIEFMSEKAIIISSVMLFAATIMMCFKRGTYGTDIVK